MPKKYPAEVHDRAVRMALDRLNDYPSVWAACQALAPKLDEAGPDAKAADQPAVKSEPDKEPCQEKAGAEH